MKRTALVMTASVVAAAVMLGFGSCSKKQDTPVTLVMAEVNPEESLAGRTGKFFKEKVEELSNGQIHIDLHCGGALGDTEEVMRMMSRPGSPVQICRQSFAGMAAFGCEKTGLLAAPYTFASHEHFWNFAHSKTAREFLDEPRERGLNMIGLFFGEEGFRHFCSTKKIEKVEDFKGLTLRTTQASLLQEMGDNFGCKIKIVPFVDMYLALQVGAVDIADQPLANYLSGNYYAVAPYLILDGHSLAAIETIITTEAWDQLSENQQQILLKAGEYASEFSKKIVMEEEEGYLKKLRENGVTITEVTDIRPWQNVCADIIARDSAKYPELYKEIQAYNK